MSESARKHETRLAHGGAPAARFATGAKQIHEPLKSSEFAKKSPSVTKRAGEGAPACGGGDNADGASAAVIAAAAAAAGRTGRQERQRQQRKDCRRLNTPAGDCTNGCQSYFSAVWHPAGRCTAP